MTHATGFDVCSLQDAINCDFLDADSDPGDRRSGISIAYTHEV